MMFLTDENGLILNLVVLGDRLLVAYGQTKWEESLFWVLVLFGGPLPLLSLLLPLNLGCLSCLLSVLLWESARLVLQQVCDAHIILYTNKIFSYS